MKAKNSLGKTLILSLLLLGAILVISLTGVISFLFWNSVITQSQESVLSYCKCASNYIDGDKIKKYSETLEKDDYYDQVADYINNLQENTSILYYYVYIPNEDDVQIIWDSDEDDSVNGSVLGIRAEYPEGGKEYCKQVFSKDPLIKAFISTDEKYGYIATAGYPVFDSNGDPVALVGTDIKLPNLKEIFFNFVLTSAMTVIVVIFLSMFLNYYIAQKKLVKPIRKLDHAARHMVNHIENGSEVNLGINADNEIGNLASSFEQMGGELREYISTLSRVMSEKERIDAELNIATKIQADMLPSIFPPFPNCPEIDLYASMHPAKEVGGDFYDFYMTDSDHLCLVIADVSGKGVPATLFMVIAKTLIKNQAMLGSSPAQTLTIVNKQLCDNNTADMFVTVWMGILELSTGIITATNGGHEYPAIYKKDEGYSLLKDKHHFVLGALEGSKYSDYTFKLDPGDRLFVYTDGIPEATDTSEKMFGTDRMLSTLNKYNNKSSEIMLTALLDSINQFTNEAPQFDDITMLSLSFLGKRNEKKILTVEASTSNLDTVIEFINESLTANECSTKCLNQIDIAFEELFTNVSSYAYAPSSGKCTISITVHNKRAVISLTDNGKEFDPTALGEPDTTLSAIERPIGGLGIHLVRKTMDAFTYLREDNKNITTIEKDIS